MKSVTLVALAAVALLGAATALVNGSRQRVRTVPLGSVASVLDALRDDDEVLELVESGVPHTPASVPPAFGPLEWRSYLADIVAVVTIEQVVPRISDDRRAVLTEVTARLDEIVKADPLDLAAASSSGRVRFTLPGGEVAVGGKRIRMIYRGSGAVRSEGQYLLLGVYSDEGELWVSWQNLYEVSNGQLRLLNPSGNATIDALDAKALEQVLPELRAYAGARRARGLRP